MKYYVLSLIHQNGTRYENRTFKNTIRTNEII